MQEGLSTGCKVPALKARAAVPAAVPPDLSNLYDIVRAADVRYLRLRPYTSRICIYARYMHFVTIRHSAKQVGLFDDEKFC